MLGIGELKQDIAADQRRTMTACMSAGAGLLASAPGALGDTPALLKYLSG